MGSTDQLRYSISDISGRETPAVAETEAISNKDRTIAAAKQFSLFLLAAVVFIPIPFLHFFFVPLFTIAAFVRGGLAMTVRTVIRQLSGSCPACSGNLVFKNLKPKDRLREACPHCRSVLTLRKNPGL